MGYDGNERMASTTVASRRYQPALPVPFYSLSSLKIRLPLLASGGVAVALSGCATLLDPDPHIAAKDWARAYEVIEMNLIHSPGSGSEGQARALSDKHPEILSYASSTFAEKPLAEWADKAGNVTWQRRRVSAYCLIAPPETCRQAIRNLEVTEKGIKPRFFVANGLYGLLDEQERKSLESKFAIRVLGDDDFGVVTDRQVHHEVTSGNKAGSALGAALASGAYVDQSFSGAPSSWSYSAADHIATQIVGAAVGGALLNKEASEQYRFRYAIRTQSGKLIQEDDVSSTSIGLSMGSCVEVATMKPLQEDLCSETLARLRERVQR